MKEVILNNLTELEAITYKLKIRFALFGPPGNHLLTQLDLIERLCDEIKTILGNSPASTGSRRSSLCDLDAVGMQLRDAWANGVVGRDGEGPPARHAPVGGDAHRRRGLGTCAGT